MAAQTTPPATQNDHDQTKGSTMPERNLLDELMKLLNQPGPINWALASQLAVHLSGPAEPIDPWVADEYLGLARFAQMHVPQATGIASDPTTEVVLVDRRGWAERNLRSFTYLAEPLAAKVDSAPGTGPLDSILKPLGPALIGMQMGAMVGMMSEQVLGLFDTGLPTVGTAAITVQLPNLESLAGEPGLDSRQVRLWSAMHEVVHQALVRRSWVRPHLVRQSNKLIGAIELSPETMTHWYEDMADPAKLEEKLAQGGGVTGLFGGPVQDESLQPMRTLIATLEGYGSYLVDRAAATLLPDLPSIRAAMSARHERRSAHSALGGVFSVESFAGIGGPVAGFCGEVQSRWGDEAVHRIWEGPENLPSPPELEDATGWAARVILDDPFA